MQPIVETKSLLSSDDRLCHDSSGTGILQMNAQVARETAMTEDNHIIKLAADVHHLQSDMTEVKGDIKSLRSLIDALRSELLNFKVEVAKEFGSVAKEFGSVAREFGLLRASIERAKLWMLVTGVGTILSVWGAALALARFLRP
jgi:hypothetical protein